MSNRIRAHLTLDHFNADTATVTSTCPYCASKRTMEVELNSLHDWAINGRLIQSAFPDMSPTDREALMTGICDDCWPEEE